MNQVKENLSEETRTISSIQDDLKKSAGQLTSDLLDDQPEIWQPPDKINAGHDKDEVDVIDLQPLEERPWEQEANTPPAENADDEVLPPTDQQPDQPADTPKDTPPTAV
jgi:hypothetical protein